MNSKHVAILVHSIVCFFAFPLFATTPYGLIPDNDGLADLKQSGMLQTNSTVGGGYQLSYIRIEQFEGSKITTRAQQTAFAFCQAQYHPVISGGYVLTKLTVSYVILDYQGRLSPDGKSTQLTLFPDAGTNSTVKVGLPAATFYRSLPDWAKTQLQLISGYLDKNPGRPVIAYQTTEGEMLTSMFGFALDLAPSSGLLKGSLGDLFENLIKVTTSQRLKNLFTNKEIRWGFKYRVTDPNILQHKDIFQAAGAAMWNF